MTPPAPPRAAPRLSPVDYYAHDDVRAQMTTYCGGSTPDTASAAYVVGLDETCGPPPTWDAAPRLVPRALPDLWARGSDVSRSLWDADALIVLLDLDYQNIDAPGEPFVRPAEAFFKLEPAYRAVMRVLGRYDIHARALVTGRGYHLTARVPLESPVIRRLADLVPVDPPWLADVDRRRPAGVTLPLSPRHARASEGLGQIIEFVAHEVYREALADTVIPVVFNGTHVGSGLVGRECASIDFSHLGDPLDTRFMRVAFSTYQWHRLRPDIFGPAASTTVGPLAAIPRQRDSLMALLTRGRGLEMGVRAAGHPPVTMPDVAAGVDRLIDAYQASPLAAFHRRYAEARARTPHAVPALDPATLPPCLAEPLAHPNDLLLRPEVLQHVVRGLLARDWTPAAVAELVRSRYEADHDWGTRWSSMHPGSRAAFEVRVFAGLLAVGLDSLVDFNCVSAQEKDLCPRLPCQYDLRRDRERLSGRRP